MKLLSKTIFARILSKIEEIYEKLEPYQDHLNELKAYTDANFIYAANHYMPLINELMELITDYQHQNFGEKKVGADELALQLETDFNASDSRINVTRLLNHLQQVEILLRAYHNKLDTVVSTKSKKYDKSCTCIGALLSLELVLYTISQKQKIEFACEEYKKYLMNRIHKMTKKNHSTNSNHASLNQVEIDNLAIKYAADDKIMMLVESYVALNNIQNLLKSNEPVTDQVGRVSQKFNDEMDADFSEILKFDQGTQTGLFMQRIANAFAFDPSMHVNEPKPSFFKRLLTSSYSGKEAVEEAKKSRLNYCA